MGLEITRYFYELSCVGKKELNIDKIGAFVLKHCFKLSEDNPKTANLPVLVQFLFIIESLLICYFLIVVVAYNLPKNRFPSTHGNRSINGIFYRQKATVLV